MPSSSAPSVCIVTADIVGPIRNGGIGTAYTGLAFALAGAGCRVTVLYALGEHCEQGTLEQWRRFYAGRGVVFTGVPDPSDITIEAPPSAQRAYAVYRWLASRQFDVVHFHEWRGVGFFALQAKRQGLCLVGATTVVGVHSPTAWAIDGMNELPTSQDTLELDLMERRSVEFADVIWSPSRYMLTWLEREQWRLPRRVMVRPYLLPVEEWRPNRRDTPVRVPIREIVFFGRLETRKGLDVFCHALDRLHSQGALRGVRVTFLGKVATVDGEASSDYVDRHARAWGVRCRIRDRLSREEALAYLEKPGRLAVMPSRIDNYPFTVLECVSRGIPCLASNTGGIPEEMYPADRDAVLFELRPSVLAERLAGALQHGAVVARPSFDLPRAVRDWAKWHIAEAARPKRRRLAMPTGRPLVSVCMTHHNRPQYLRQAIDSVVRQDYQPLELVLVDDSDQADARAAVARYETEFERRGWKIVTVSDRFVGAARNAAARHARGKYVLFMDDDNVAKPHEVSTLVKAAEHAGADVLTCFLDAFTGERPPRSTASVMRRWPFYGRSAAAGLFRNVLGDTNCLVRRRAFLAAGGFTEDEQVGFEDWEMLGRLVKAGLRIEVVPEALVWFRVTGTGMASRHSGRPDHVRALRPFLEMYPGESRLMLKYAKHLSLSQGGQSWAPGARPVATDVRLVRSVAIFGAGEGGRRTATLADTWRWRVACVVDNNQSLWGKRTPWCQVDAPARLEKRDFDLVVVASMAGRDAIMRQLRGMGFPPSREVAYFLDPFDSGTMRVQLTL